VAQTVRPLSLTRIDLDARRAVAVAVSVDEPA
jgi:hypothetical protein